jgi:hypothetical protein
MNQKIKTLNIFHTGYHNQVLSDVPIVMFH